MKMLLFGNPSEKLMTNLLQTHHLWASGLVFGKHCFPNTSRRKKIAVHSMWVIPGATRGAIEASRVGRPRLCRMGPY
jgi:hypothetical protein